MSSIKTSNHKHGIEDAEQIICTRCGLCCDGTLFVRARVGEEDVARLEKHPMHFEINESRSHFKLPCHYQKEKCCSVYSGWRPRVCSEFVCKTIVRFRNGKITFDEALTVIKNTLSHQERVMKLLATPTTHGKQGLRALFNAYMSSHPLPDPLILLECAAFQRRLQLHFSDKTTKLKK